MNASSLCDALNERFVHGKRTNEWKAAGVLMRVLDGVQGCRDFPDLRNLWGSSPHVWGDRASCTLVNRHHPNIFNATDLFNPGFVLAPTHETTRRIKCLYHMDLSSHRFNCIHSFRNRTDCHSGCSPHVCGAGRLVPSDPWWPMPAMWWCHYRPDQLSKMMLA